jgi:hypothetical protein
MQRYFSLIFYIIKRKALFLFKRKSAFLSIIPMVGVEPTLPKEHDFESCASANSATSA